MKGLGIISLLSLLSISRAAELEGFVVTTSKKWIRNEDATISVSKFFNDSSYDGFNINFLVTPSSGSTNYFNKTEQITSTNDEIFKITLPIDVEDMLVLQVTIDSFDMSYHFEQNTSVYMECATNFVFIQTDKPYYKPSDKIKIRLLALDAKNLKPLVHHVEKAYITDSQNTRITQWIKPESRTGIYDFELPLSSDPRLGKWEFVAETLSGKKTKSLNVEKYVLPKFSVTIESTPPLIRAEDPSENTNISYKICAKYTYGESVSGFVYFNQHEKSGQKHQLAKDGCVTIHNLINVQDTLVNATVFEEGTGISRFVTHVTPLHGKFRVKYSPFCKEYIKPGIDFHCSAKAYYSDGMIANNVTFLIPGGMPAEVVSDDDGHIPVMIPAKITENFSWLSISVSVKEPPTFNYMYDYYGLFDSELYLKRWISPSFTYLGIVDTHDKDGYINIDPFNLTFLLTTKALLPSEEITFRYLVYLDGNLFKSGSFMFDPTDESPSILTSPAVSSAYSDDINNSAQSDDINSSVQSDDIINDDIENDDINDYVQSVDIKGFVQIDDINSIQESFSFYQYKHSVDLNLTGAEGSVKFLLYYQTSGGSEIISDIVKFKARHESKNEVKMEFSSSQLQPGLQTVLHIQSSEKSLCSVSVFDRSLEIMSPVDYLTPKKVEDLWNVEYVHRSFIDKDFPIPCIESDHASNSLARTWNYRGRPTFTGTKDLFQSEGIQVLSDFRLSQQFCLPYSFPQAMFSETLAMPIALSSQHQQVAVHRDFFPESWIWDLFEIEENEQGKDIPLTLPHTITEWSGNGFCISEETGLGISPRFSIVGVQPFFLSLNLPYSIIRGERAIVPLKIVNYLNICIKVELNFTHTPHLDLAYVKSDDIVVCNEETKVINLTLIAKQFGKVNLTILARSQAVSPLETNDVYSEDEVNVQDSVTYSVLVEPEGTPEEIVNGAFVCAPAIGELFLKPPEKKVVRGTKTSFVSVYGEFLAPIFANLDNLLALPTGCGEQNMVKFVPNIYILNYLEKSGLLDKTVEQKALNYLTIGYQGELQYKRNDDSYSAFGKADAEGSLWLTAFVVKSFAAASKHIYVDQSDLDDSILFIVDKQLDNGCFPVVGKLLNERLMGNLNPTDGHLSFSYNAYIVSSIVEAGCPLNDTVVQKGYECLETGLNSISNNTVYDNILLLYAYSLIAHSDPRYLEIYQRILAQVDTDSVNGSGIYWGSESNPAAAVEMTSYMILSLMKGSHPDLTRLSNMAKWLATMQNSGGGFYSTQDTVMALNALSSVASLTSGAPNVTINFPDLKNVAPFVINSTNKLLLQRAENVFLPQKPIRYRVRGSGCAVVQVGTKMNLETFTGDQHTISMFNMSVGVKPNRLLCKEKSIHICFVYNGEEESIGMAVLSVKLPTGWVVDTNSLDKLYTDIDTLKRHETEEGHIVFYFDEVTTLETCFHFIVHQNIMVLQAKPAIIKLYEYYNPEISSFVEYTIPQSCPRPSSSLTSRPKRLRRSSTKCPTCLSRKSYRNSKQRLSLPYCFIVKSDPGSNYFQLFLTNHPAGRSSLRAKTFVFIPEGCYCEQLEGNQETVYIASGNQTRFLFDNSQFKLYLASGDFCVS